MPNVFTALGYTVYFWSNENNEPIHVHISKGKPIENATKIWITKYGACIVEHNKSKIPKRDLDYLMEMITAQFFYICRKWKEHLNLDEINFYC